MAMDPMPPDKKDTDHNRIEKLLMFIIIAIVAAIVGFIWHSKQVADKNLNVNNPTKQTVKQSASTPAAKTPTTQAQKSAVNLAESAYKTANAYASNNSTDASQGEIDAIKTSLSPSLYSKLSANLKNRPTYDPILCAQEFPDGFNASLIGTKGNTATVVVTETFGPSQQHITVAIDLTSQQLTSISCPATQNG